MTIDAANGRIIRILALIAASAPQWSWAHPGHGSTDPVSVQHYLLEPSHAVPLALLILAVPTALLYRKIRALRRPQKDPARIRH